MSTDLSVLEVIRRLQADAENGTLILERAEERLSIFYREGFIQFVSLNTETHRLGTYLVRDGSLPQREIPGIAAEARKKQTLFGEVAVHRKHLDPADVAAVVRRQATDLLLYGLENQFRVQSFTKGIRSVYAPAAITGETILLELSRLNRSVLSVDSTTLLKLKKHDTLSGVPWFPKELAILGALTAPCSIDTLMESTGLDEPTVRRILGVLDRLGIIEEAEADPDASSSQSNLTTTVKTNHLPFQLLVPVVSNAVLGEEMETIRNPSSIISEQFKTLKVRLRHGTQNPPRVITISSPEQQDGKSLISANFGWALSLEPGRRTVLVDCDLRSPKLDRYLGVPVDPGLIQHLSDGRLPAYCWMRRIGNLYFMSAGGSSETPTELLSLRKMKDLVEILKSNFDNVVLDAPPFSPVADAQIMSELSDGIILVIRSGKTSNRSVERAFQVVDRKKFLGVVFNDVQPTLFSKYFDRYSYSYGMSGQYGYSKRRQVRSSQTKGYLDN